MSNTIITLPESLFERLNQRARLRGVTVDAEASELLHHSLDHDAEAKLLEETRRDREALAKRGVYVTEDFINESKRWGRK